MGWRNVAAAMVLGAALGAPAAAEASASTTVSAEAGAAAVVRGSETGLPLPRYVSLRAGRANLRRGPATSHRVDWVLTRRGMPLEITAEHGLWRRVRDADGETGWLHHSLLRGDRTAMVTAETLDLRAAASEDAVVTARAERGVILPIQTCIEDWCRLGAGRTAGWAPKAAIWGAAAHETF